MFSEGGWAVWLVLAWLLLDVGIVFGTGLLVVRVWRQRAQATPTRKFLAALAAVGALLAGGGPLFGLATAFGAVGGESIDPSQKARILAEGISEAMNCTAFGVLVWLPTTVVLAALMWRAARKQAA